MIMHVIFFKLKRIYKNLNIFLSYSHVQWCTCVDIQSKRTVQIKKDSKVENSFCSLVKDTEFESSEEKKL